jgi:hypothetical protein
MLTLPSCQAVVTEILQDIRRSQLLSASVAVYLLTSLAPATVHYHFIIHFMLE